MAIGGGLGVGACGYWFFVELTHRKYSVPIFLLCLLVFIASFFTASGEIYRKQFFYSTIKGCWFVVDNSGGETMRHWILEKGYVKDSTQSDGWQFTDVNGNLCYVSGDAFVMQINEPLDEFLKTYRTKYNIPKGQEALH